MYLDKDAILKSLTKEDVTKVVTLLGSQPPKTDGNGNLIFQTVCHNMPDPSNSWKLYYYHEPSGEHTGRVFHCYTGCSESFNIVELVIRANRVQGHTVTWYKALRWIGQVTGKLVTGTADSITESNHQIEDFSWIERLKRAQRNKKSIPTLKGINENILEMFCYAPYKGWLDEHISAEAMSRYEIGYWGETDQLTIPHRDKNGTLIGIRGRYLDQQDAVAYGKYTPLYIEGTTLRHQLGNNLYGIHVVQDHVKSMKKCMLVEAEKSCLQAYTYFGDNSFVMATCGSNITLTQQKLLLNYLHVEEVIVGFDREYHDPHSYEATAYYNKLVKKVAPMIPYVRVCLVLDSKERLPYKASPTDMGKDVLLELLDEKVEITTDEVRRVLSEK